MADKDRGQNCVNDLGENLKENKEQEVTNLNPNSLTSLTLEKFPSTKEGKGESQQQEMETSTGISNDLDAIQNKVVDLNNVETHLQLNVTADTCVGLTSLMQDKNSKQVNLDTKSGLAAKGKTKGETSNVPQQAMKPAYGIQNNFRQVSNNIGKFTPNNRNNKETTKQPLISDNTTNNQPKNPFPNTKKDLVRQPAPYTVVHTLATTLRLNQAKNEIPIEFSTPKVTTKQGLPIVIFKKEDFMVKLAARCKFTSVGKFSNTMPKLELIRKNFIL